MMDKRLLSLVPEALRHVIAAVIWQWIGLIGNVALVWAISTVLSSLFIPITPDISMNILLAVLALGIIMRTIATRAAATQSFAASQDVKRVLRRKIYEKVLKLGPRYSEQMPTAEVVQLSVEGCEQLETYFGQYLPQLFYSVLAPVTLFIILLFVCAPAAIVLLVCVPLIPVTIVAVQKIAKRILSKYWDQYAELGDSFLENLQGLTTLKIYQADATRHEAMNHEAEHFRKVTMAVLSMQLNSIIVMDIVALGGAVAGIAVALVFHNAGSLDLFGTLFIVLLSADFFLPMRQLGSYFHVAMNGIAASNKIFEFLALEEPAAKTLKAEQLDHFALNSVSFSYDGEREVLHDISLDIPVCGLTAIVGESGSGKSTVAALLSGRYDTYSGDVLLGGKQVRDIDQASLARYVTTVGLGSHLFAGTVRENLLMAAPNASDEKLWDALELARLADFLREQDGLDTKLTQNAANLSGGQRQRLSLARAVLHNSAVYIFDEATSNIDIESEEAIMAALGELAHTHAVIVISHRLANAMGAQCVYVLEHGAMVGAGTHAELLANCPSYQALWQTQEELEALSHGGEQSETVAAAAPSSSASSAHSTNSSATQQNKTSKLHIMWRMLGLAKPLAGIIVVAVLCGVAGFCCATGIPVLAAYTAYIATVTNSITPLGTTIAILACMAVARGVLHYIEQRCNHYIAFKLLAHIRDLVFGALRKLAPAKLAGANRGDLISTITSDVELLEVFYAHTISPICIAVLMAAIMGVFLGNIHPALAALALISYVLIGVMIPTIISRSSGTAGKESRTLAGTLSGFVLDSLRGLGEVVQFGAGETRLAELDARSNELIAAQRKLRNTGAAGQAIATGTIMVLSCAQMLLAVYLCNSYTIDLGGAILATVATFSSFGPFVALANLGSTLQGTLASGERVLAILDEEPEVEEVNDSEGAFPAFANIAAENVSFAYASEQVLTDVSVRIDPGEIVAISGKSGSGKSTLCRLLMRFWDVNEGRIALSDEDVRGIATSCLRQTEAFVEQDTHLFHDSIADNLRIAKSDATQAELEEACKAASVHDFILSLPAGYDTMVGELGDTLSGGERQRLGLARAFLHDSALLLLDEPTSNLDSLNEGQILKSLKEQRGKRAIVLISHRPSTSAIADRTYSMDSGRVS